VSCCFTISVCTGGISVFFSVDTSTSVAGDFCLLLPNVVAGASGGIPLTLAS